jgi:hypothetical protein
MSRPTPIRVAVHVRPLLDSESREGAASIVVVGAGNRVGASAACVSGAAAAAPLSFGSFDAVFSSASPPSSSLGPSRPPATMYAELVEPLVRAVVEDAESACVLAYGATGGGKTYTMGTTAAAVTGAATAADNNNNNNNNTNADAFVPLAPAAIRDVCARCERLREIHGDPDAARVYASCLEVYGDSLHDLLAASAASAAAAEDAAELPSSSSPPPPPVIAWRDPGGADDSGAADAQTLSLPGLTEVPIDDAEAALAALRAACRGRATASTGANARSSRSHAVFSLRVRTRKGGEMGAAGETCEARLMLVDLAGSERQARSGAGGVRLAEACAINQGLLALGNVIDALAFNSRAMAAAEGGRGGIGGQSAVLASVGALDAGLSSLLATPCSSAPSSPRGGNGGPLCLAAPFVPPLALPQLAAAAAPAPPLRHVPFRSHVLTRLLRPALGGNSRTVMVACISPSDLAWPETCCSLRYAQRLRAVRTRPRRGLLLPPPMGGGAADPAMAAALRDAREQLGRLLEERAGLEARALEAEARAEGLEGRLREAEARLLERAGEGKAAAAAAATSSPLKRRDAVVALGPGGDAPSPSRARQQAQPHQQQEQQQQQQQQQQLARALAAAEARLRETEPRAAQRDEAVRQLVEARLALAEAEEQVRWGNEERLALVARVRSEGVRQAAQAAVAASASSASHQQGVVGAATAAVGAALASLTGSLRR